MAKAITKYMCELCGKLHNTMTHAIMCEASHKDVRNSIKMFETKIDNAGLDDLKILYHCLVTFKSKKHKIFTAIETIEINTMINKCVNKMFELIHTK